MDLKEFVRQNEKMNSSLITDWSKEMLLEAMQIYADEQLRIANFVKYLPRRDKSKIKLKDYFAAKALQGIMSNNEMWRAMCKDRSNCTRDKQNDSVEDYVAQECYKMAEAMLREQKH